MNKWVISEEPGEADLTFWTSDDLVSILYYPEGNAEGVATVSSGPA